MNGMNMNKKEKEQKMKNDIKVMKTFMYKNGIIKPNDMNYNYHNC